MSELMCGTAKCLRLLAMLLMVLPGCAPQKSTLPDASATDLSATSPAAADSPATVRRVSAGDPPVANSVEPLSATGPDERLARLVGQDRWDVYYLGGARFGYGSTRWRRMADKPDLIVASGMLRLSIKRFGEVSDSEVSMSVVETTAGEIRSFESDARLGPTPNRARGKLVAGTMQITLDSGGQTRGSSIAWPKGTGGYFVVDEELLCRPMRPGERRTVRSLMPIFNQIAEIELRAVQLESTELLDGRRELLRIETTTKLPGADPMEGVMWTDRDGETVKTLTTALDQVAYRTTKAIALGKSEAAGLDLGDRSLVRLAKPLADPHRAKEIHYRCHLDEGDPARVFLSDASQQVTAIDPHTAEIVVRALRPAASGAEGGTGDRASGSAGTGEAAKTPTDDDRQPNSFIQSDNPRIVAMAREGAGNEKDPWRTAVALERYVRDKVKVKNYSQTFATAADVAQSLEGDCTEHAVLLAALLRARGLPARVAIGLVYVPAEQAFGFHMWTEVYVDGQWIGVDGTLGLGGIGAGHLKLATSSLKEATAFSSFLPVAQVLGKLKIEVRDENR
ncbi:MAG TPA: transglutaminase-like domain-containing protein [Pirellulales bacterium]